MSRVAFQRELRAKLHQARPPDAAEAERRAWEIVQAAHAERAAAPRRERGRRLAVVALAASLVAVLALSPARAKVGDLIDKVVNPAPDATPATLGSLPTKGRLLVVSPSGPWVVEDDGARRRLGDFRDAAWSPGGLYVVAVRGRELVALEPDGDERWVLPAPGRVQAPRWSPDGFRIAYRSGRDLWIAVGDNSGRWRLARRVGPAPVAWQPGRPSPGQVLAFSVGRRIKIEKVDGRRLIGSTPPSPVPRELWWTADGRRLVAVSRREIRVHDRRGRLLRRFSLPAGLRVTGSVLDAAGRRLAVAAQRARRRASELLLYRLGVEAPPSRLFAGPGLIEGLTWSLDGRVLVLGLPEADQFLLLRPGARGRLQQISGIRRKFGASRRATGATTPFPRPAGWCYAKPATSSDLPCSTGAAPAGGLGH